MNKAILLLTIFISCNVFAQQGKDSLPLTKKEFYAAVKQDFNSLLGNDEKSINNAITTSFDKNETSVTAKFLIDPNQIKK